MDTWKDYIFSLITAGLISGILSQICADSRAKNLIHLIFGVVLTLFLFHPLLNGKISNFAEVPTWPEHSAEHYIAEGELLASEAMVKNIKEAAEAYIITKANSLGGEITAQIVLNENNIPVAAQILQMGSTSIQAQLEPILSVDLGIPKENQTWIWNQEETS